jgi:hypothetical protein
VNLGPINKPVLSPVGGRLPLPLSTQGTPQANEKLAHSEIAWVSEADLDLFLRKAAEKSQGPPKKGVLGLVQKLFGAPPPVQTRTGAQVKDELKSTLDTLAQVYADGIVAEHEVGALWQAKGRLNAVLAMLEPDVMLMLPRDVRERLEQRLQHPVEILAAAAERRSARLFQAIEQRDAGELMKRLDQPVEFRTLDVQVLMRAGLEPDALSRYVPGDLINVPRSDGSFSRGVVVANRGGALDVEMMTAEGRFAKKTLYAADVTKGNPLKVGDAFNVNSEKVWVSGSDAHGLYGHVDGPAGRRVVRADELNALYRQRAMVFAGQTVAPVALGAVQAYSHVNARMRGALLALFSLKNDPVFGKLATELSHQAQRPEFLAMPPAGQARVFEQLMKKTEWLPEVMPGFGAVRESVSDVRYKAPYWDDGSKYFQVDSQRDGAPPRAVMQPIDVSIGTTMATVHVAFPESFTQAQRTAATFECGDTLRRLPPEVLVGLKTIVINPVRNPADAYFAQKFGMPDFTSAMTAHADTRAVTVYPGTSIAKAVQDFCHEVGHLVSIDVFGSISDNGGPGWAAWTQAAANDPLACSQYGLKASHEDFAETFSLYTSTKGTARHDAYRALMPHRFALLDQIAHQVSP